MENYKIIVKHNIEFHTATFDNGDIAKMAFDGITSAIKEHTRTRATTEYYMFLANTETKTILREIIIDEGTIYEQ